MAIFWQHVGDQNSKRDFPRTIGTTRLGLRQLSVGVIEPNLDDAGPIYNTENRRRLKEIEREAVQIWGLPSGASPAFAKMDTGDHLMLLDSNGFGGAFRYIGKIIVALKGQNRDISFKLWTEHKFPLIVILQGTLVDYAWEQFLKDFNFGMGFRPMGRTYRISQKAFSSAIVNTDYDFVDYVTTKYAAKDVE
jgi:hypothetical protein